MFKQKLMGRKGRKEGIITDVGRKGERVGGAGRGAKETEHAGVLAFKD